MSQGDAIAQLERLTTEFSSGWRAMSPTEKELLARRIRYVMEAADVPSIELTDWHSALQSGDPGRVLAGALAIQEQPTAALFDSLLFALTDERIPSKFVRYEVVSALEALLDRQLLNAEQRSRLVSALEQTRTNALIPLDASLRWRMRRVSDKCQEGAGYSRGTSP